MADLDAAIRAKLDGWLDDLCGVWRRGCVVEEHANAIWMRGAIEAVLGLHKSTEGWRVGELVCTCLPDPDDTYMAHAYPCPTVRAIAEKLGVEVRDG